MELPRNVDVLILEDNATLLELILCNMPQRIIVSGVETSEELKEFLEQERRAKLYFLDDQVPGKKGGAPDYKFMYHSRLVLEKMPEGIIFYIGSTSDARTKSYCLEKGIEIIERRKINDKIRQLLLSS